MIQNSKYSCSIACLRILLEHYSIQTNKKLLLEMELALIENLNLEEIVSIFSSFGLGLRFVELNWELLSNRSKLPILALVHQCHLIVIHKIDEFWIYTSDPSFGLVNYEKFRFLNIWLINGTNRPFNTGICGVIDVL